jgi:hypothetical protein
LFAKINISTEKYHCLLKTALSVIIGLLYLQLTDGSRVSSGSIVSDYGLDDRAIGVRSPAGAKDFSSNLCVQTGSEAHPASCTMSTWGPFPGGKARPGRDADHSTLSSAEVVNEWELYFLSPQAPPWRVEGLLYFYNLLITLTYVDIIIFMQGLPET